MKLKLITLAMLGVLSQSANADNNEFTGLTVGANITSVNTTVKETDTFNGDIYKHGENSILGSVQAGYTFGIGENSTLGIGVSYVIGDLKSGADPVGSDEYKGKGHYSIFIEPGYAVGDSTLLYGKLGYAAMDGFDIDSGSLDEKVKARGVIVGFGMRKVINSKFYFQFEVSQSSFGSKTETTDPTDDPLKFKVNQASLGLGYRF